MPSRGGEPGPRRHRDPRSRSRRRRPSRAPRPTSTPASGRPPRPPRRAGNRRPRAPHRPLRLRGRRSAAADLRPPDVPAELTPLGSGSGSTRGGDGGRRFSGLTPTPPAPRPSPFAAPTVPRRPLSHLPGLSLGSTEARPVLWGPSTVAESRPRRSWGTVTLVADETPPRASAARKSCAATQGVPEVEPVDLTFMTTCFNPTQASCGLSFAFLYGKRPRPVSRS